MIKSLLLFLLLLFVTCELALHAASLNADASVTAEVELSCVVETPLHWRLTNPRTGTNSGMLEKPGRIAVPRGVYRLDVKTVNGSWLAVKQLEVDDERVHRVYLDSGVKLKSIDGIPPPSWRIYDDANRQIASIKRNWGFVPLPAGSYTVKSKLDGQDGQVITNVTVSIGQVTDIDVGTGVLVNAGDAPVPQRWMLKPVDAKGRQVAVRGRWGGALAAPGEYWVVFEHRRQPSVKYQRVSVEKGKISTVTINSGFHLESKTTPEYYSLNSLDNDMRLRSRNLETLFAPPGAYSVIVKMPEQMRVKYADDIQIIAGAITRLSVDTGVQMVGDKDLEFHTVIRRVEDNKLVTQMNASHAFIPLQAGRYRMLVNTKDQSPIAYRTFTLAPDIALPLAVNSGVDLHVDAVFGASGNWTLEAVDSDASTNVSRRWGRAVAPAGSYQLLLKSQKGSTVNYGVFKISNGQWLDVGVDSGLHIDIDEADSASSISVYRQGESEPIYSSRLDQLHVPLPAGSYRAVLDSPDGYVWGRPFVVEPAKITRIDDDFLHLAGSKKARILAENDGLSGFNIAKEQLGGRVISYSSQRKDTQWHARNLIDGFDYIENINMTDHCEKSCGWLSQKQTVSPPEVTIGFYRDRSAWINAVVVDNAFKSGTSDKMHKPRHVAILASNESPDSGFAKVADAQLEPEANPQLIQLPEEIHAKYVKLRILSSYGGNLASLGEIRIVESPSKPSIIADMPKDLARPENGGSIAWFSSQAQRKLAAQLVWQGDEHWTGGWYSGKGPAGNADYLPQDIVFGFKQYRVASIDHITIDPAGLDLSESNLGRANLAKEVVIERSMSSPVKGFTEIARTQLPENGQAKTVKINKRARFIKLRIVSTQGDGSFVKLGRVSIIESLQEDGDSILRGVLSNTNTASPGIPSKPTVATQWAEVEPNDNQMTATQLTASQWVSGTIKPLGEQDYYRLSLARPSIVTTELSSRPFIQTQIDVEDAHSERLYHFSPNESLSSDEQFSLKIDAGDYYYRLTQSTNSIVLVWDTSGSMKGSEQALERAVRDFIEGIRASEKLQLIRFGGGVKVLSKAFSNDVEHLKQLAKDQFKPNGGTPLYKAIVEAMELLQDAAGNKVIVLMSDGKDTNNKTIYPELWHKVKSNGIRFYTLGLGESLWKYNINTGGTGQQFLDYLAMSTYGKYWHTDNSEDLESLYETVAKEVTSQAAYRLKVTIDEHTGLLQLTTRDKLLAATTSSQFEVILDASGSMVSSNQLIDDRLKIDVAKEVLAHIVEDLPESSKLGFRVFGHRIKEYQPGDCQDSELISSIQRFNKEELHGKIDKVVATNGTTPLSYSIVQAAKDLLGLHGRTHIVLVTDGQEYCGAEPQEVVRQLLNIGIDIRIDIVGMDLRDPLLRKNMQSIARMTRGEFYNIQSSETLERAIQSALGANYTVKDAAGRVITHGIVNGHPVKLQQGIYHIDIESGDEQVRVGRVEVFADRITRVDIVKNGELIEPAAVEIEEYGEPEWQFAKPAVVAKHPENSTSVTQRQKQLKRLEQQIIAAESNRPTHN